MQFEDKTQSAIECWSIDDAPPALRNMLMKVPDIDWVARVPKELRGDDVVGLLTMGPGVQDVLYKAVLTDGSLVIAGSSTPDASRPSQKTSIFDSGSRRSSGGLTPEADS